MKLNLSGAGLTSKIERIPYFEVPRFASVDSGYVPQLIQTISVKMNMLVIITPILCCLQVTELQIDVNDNGVSRMIGEAEDDDEVGDFEGIPEDTDEEYVPVAEPSSSPPSTSTARKRKAQCKTDKNENGEAAEEDSKKDSVQCPVCDKSFKSKYYLKVHNRYTSSAFSFPISLERISTDVSFS